MSKLLFLPLLFLLALLLYSCAAMPELAKAAEDIADDTAIELEISREALQKQTDVSIKVDIINKDPK